MPASHRIEMGLALHLGQMSRKDWISLPGVGLVQTDRIKKDRQKNGEFGSYVALTMVNGIVKNALMTRKIFLALCK